MNAYYPSSGVRHGLRRRWFGLAVIGTIVLWTGISEAGLSEPVIRVEEDWKLVLNEPDVDCEAPQFHTVMSPYNHVDSNYAQVLWNYRETAEQEFVPGGMQIQSWNGDYLIRRRAIDMDQLSIYAETITWTQGLETDGDVVSFEIINGQSTTWGEFGKDMRIDENAELPDLGSYSPEVSVQNSWFTYGANRVDSLVITEVRYYGASGLLFVDSVPRTVYQSEE